MVAAPDTRASTSRGDPRAAAAFMESAGRRKKPQTPVEPRGRLDLPPELLTDIFVTIYPAAAPVPPTPVAYPAALNNDPVAVGAPLVGARGWTAAAGAAGACRALRAAATQAVVALELDFGAPLDDPSPLGGEPAYRKWLAVERARLHARMVEGVERLLHRHRSLWVLRVRLDQMHAGAADLAMARVARGLCAPAAPQLVALSTVVHPTTPMPAGVFILPSRQGRLRHLLLLSPADVELLGDAARPLHDVTGAEVVSHGEAFSTLYTALGPRLSSDDLQVLAPTLDGDLAESLAAEACLAALPVLPNVTFLGLHTPATASLLATAARVCPNVTARLLSDVRGSIDADAAELVRLLPRVDRLGVA